MYAVFEALDFRKFVFDFNMSITAIATAVALANNSLPSKAIKIPNLHSLELLR